METQTIIVLVIVGAIGAFMYYKKKTNNNDKERGRNQPVGVAKEDSDHVDP